MMLLPNNTANENYTTIPFDGYTTLQISLAAVPVLLILLCIVLGNAMVICAVFVNDALRGQFPNWFIVSLAFSDFLVGLLVMPLSLAYEITGIWKFGPILCEIWLALDVLFVTASILNLCLISLDRYWAITKPLKYPQMRTKGRVLGMIFSVWFLAFAISFPPLIGWRQPRGIETCSLSTDVGYVAYSSMGSFYIPVVVLLIVYSRIFMVTRRRAIHQIKSVKETERRLSSNAKTSIIIRSETTDLSSPIDDNSLSTSRRKSSVLLSYFSSSTGRKTSASSSRSIEPPFLQAKPSAPPYFTNAIPTPVRKVSHEPPREGKRSATSSATSAYVAATTTGLINSCCTIGAHVNPHLKHNLAVSRLPAYVDPKAASMAAKHKRLRKREKRSTLILGTIMTSFIGCWFPFFTMYLLGSLGIVAPESLFDVTFWLGYCNSALNPIIYTVFNRSFRQAFAKILFDHTCCPWHQSYNGGYNR